MEKTGDNNTNQTDEAEFTDRPVILMSVRYSQHHLWLFSIPVTDHNPVNDWSLISVCSVFRFRFLCVNVHCSASPVSSPAAVCGSKTNWQYLVVKWRHLVSMRCISLTSQPVQVHPSCLCYRWWGCHRRTQDTSDGCSLFCYFLDALVFSTINPHSVLCIT